MKTSLLFSDLIPDWPEAAPSTGIELRRTDYDALRELLEPTATEAQIEKVLAVRRQLILGALSSSEPAALSVEAAKSMIESNFLYPMARKWVTYPLRKDRTRIVAPRDGGGADALKVVTRRVPTVSHLAEDAPLPEKGVYLILYGGSPDILSLSDKNGRRVEDDLAEVLIQLDVADVLFRHLVKGESAATYSLRAGVGERASQALAFPDSDVLARLRALL